MGAILPILFGLVALIYASVGFGGGSSYTALLTLSGIEHRLIPIISLACNIVVVSGGSFRFAMARLIVWRRFLPLLLVSAP
ncbi:MAG: sulfite exporter TauE/SafE family protein, partial [Sphingorhabdus sp.]